MGGGLRLAGEFTPWHCCSTCLQDDWNGIFSITLHTLLCRRLELGFYYGTFFHSSSIFFFFLESQCPSSRCVYHLAVVVHSSGVQDGGAVAITALSPSPPLPRHI